MANDRLMVSPAVGRSATNALLQPIPETSWQESMKLAIRDAIQLLKMVGLSEQDVELSSQGESQFPVFVPHEYLRRIVPGNPNDPLLLQVLPRREESIALPDYVEDPVGDLAVEVMPGLLHKYPGRVLLIVSGVCAVHCRYCFRRHYPYQNAPKSLSAWDPSLWYVENDPTIHEVILSGGDPLTVVDSVLKSLVDRIETIPHVQRLRIHTRLPVVIPQRVTDELCDILASTRLSCWVVLHINHPQELDQSLMQAISKLRESGASILNQAVLLKGINDQAETLTTLMERLIDRNVSPYYLHQLDRVAGGAHFEVDASRGRELMREIRERLPGYAVPQYVQERSGQPSKTPL